MTGPLFLVNVIVLIVAGGIVLFALFFMLVARMEKNQVYPFEPCDERELPEASAYTRAMNEAADEKGFINCGWYRQNSGKLCGGTVTMWFSPDRLILVLVGEGKIARIVQKKTLFFSKTTEGPFLISMDETSTIDLSNVSDTRFLLNADFDELFDFHQSRMEEQQGRIEPFKKSALEEYNSFSRRRAESLVERGYAKFIFAGRECWRYTTKGAVLVFFRGFRDNLEKTKEQIGRSKKKRPGD